ncbi:ABC transporter ATP-binding protein [Streptomyces sp. NPDC002138]|uniref:ABC transporter ATP-binding protein n=1 Tax=Streptomyces sp. NPDC002138 TaxID=3154410 RepID=UPI00331794DB
MALGKEPTAAPHRPPAGGRHWARRLAGYARYCRGQSALAVGAAVVGLSVAALVPVLERAFVDRVVVGGGPAGALTAALLGAAGMVFVTTLLRRRAGSRAALEIQFRLRTALFAALPRLAGRWDTAEVVSRSASDLAAVQRLLLLVPTLVGNTLYLLIAITCMVVMSWQLSLLVLLVVPLWALLSRRWRRRLDEANGEVQERTADLVRIADRVIGDVEAVKGFGQERRETRTFATAARRTLTAQLRLARLRARSGPALGALTAAAQVCAVGGGGLLALRGELTLGTYLAFCTYLEQTSGPVRVFTTLLATGRQSRTGALRVFELLDAPAQVTGPADAAAPPTGAPGLAFRAVDRAADRAVDRPAPSGPALRDFTLTVRPGEVLAVVGAATDTAEALYRLLARHRDPAGGALRVGEHDVRRYALAPLRALTGLVAADPVLFRGSVRDNLTLGRPGGTGAEPAAAIRAAGLTGLVRDLPRGLDTEVGEHGRLLSGGQRQRIALARALLTPAAVLVLDDPTSAVDPVQETRILAGLREALRGRTVLLVTRRRPAALIADRVAVVDGGRVVDVGTHAELTERCARFRELLREEVGPDAGPAAAPTPVPVPVPVDGPAPPPGVEAPGDDAGPGALVRRMRGSLLTGLLLVALCTGADLLLPLVVHKSVDGGIGAGSSAVVLAAAAAGLGVVGAKWAAAFWRIRSTERTGALLLQGLRLQAFTRLQRLGLDYYDREPSGRILTLLTADAEAVAGLLQNGAAVAVVQLVTFLGVTAALLALDLRTAGVVLAFLPVLAVAALVFRRASASAYGTARTRLGALNAELREGAAGLTTLQSCGAWERARARHRALCDAQRRAQQRAQDCGALYFPLTELCSTGAATAVLTVGAGAVRSGALSVGALVACLLYVYLFFDPLRQLSQVFDSYQQASVGLRHLRELRAVPVLPATSPGAVPAPPLRGEIVLDGVGFRYPGSDRDALKDITLSIPAGQTLALVGPSGAGKSTLAKLVARFHDPATGAVRVDGHDIRTFEPASYRRRLGIVPQESRLVAETVRDAIRYGRPEAGDAEVERAARAVGAHAAIERLAGGYGHPASGRGGSLPVTERRLIARARAELADPDILLLDEPTTRGAGPRSAARPRTTVLIVHELGTAARADRIAVLDHGRLAETGSHAELLARGGRYAALWAAYTDAPAPAPPRQGPAVGRARPHDKVGG